MSKHCEEIRPLLAELVYGELDPDVAESIRQHLGTCLPCRRYQMAFDAVRTDLHSWQPGQESAPRGVTFIAPTTQPPTLWRSKAFQGLAIAASFTLGVFLMAAVVNLQVQSDQDGWTVSTSLWQPQVVAEPLPDAAQQPGALAERAEPTNADAAAPPELTGPATSRPRLVSLDDPALRSWFDQQLVDRGFVPASEVSVPTQLTSDQWDQVDQRLQDRIVQVDTQHEQYFRDMIAASEARQAEQFTMTLASLYETLETEFDDELVHWVSQFGLVQVDTERRLQQAHTRIDNLVTQVSSTPQREREPEQ